MGERKIDKREPLKQKEESNSPGALCRTWAANIQARLYMVNYEARETSETWNVMENQSNTHRETEREEDNMVPGVTSV